MENRGRTLPDEPEAKEVIGDNEEGAK